jgi:hypothetical protein
MRFIVLLLILLLPSLARAQGGVKAGPWSTNVPPAPIYGNNTTTVSNTVTHKWWDFWGTNPMTVAHLEDVTNIVNGLPSAGDQVWTNNGTFIYASTYLTNPVVIGSTAPFFGFGANQVEYGLFVETTNKNPGSVNLLYDYGGSIGIFGHAMRGPADVASTNGQAVGVMGSAETKQTLQYGVIGFVQREQSSQTNVGVAGSAIAYGGSGAQLIGGYFEVNDNDDSDPPFLSSALLLDNRDTGLPIIIGRSNKVTVFQLNADGTLNTFGFTNQGPVNLSGTVTNHGSETIKGQTRLWQNVFVGASGADLFEVDASSGNIEIIRGVTSYSWPLSHSTGALTNNGDGQLGWFDGFLTSSATNTLAANSRSELNSASNSILTQVSSAVGISPFVVIDNTPYYPTNPWNHIVSEEWQGDVTSGSLPLGSTHAWGFVNSGNTFFRVAPLTESGAFSYLSLVTTNSGTAVTYFLSGTTTPGFLLATNVEIIFTARIRIGLTNTSAEVQKCIVGLVSSVSANEPANGIYITVNTNVNTNTFVACTARASSRTFNYNTHASNTWSPFTWVNVGFRLDQNGTNAVFFAGPSLTNLTAFATNQASIPDSVLTGPAFTVHRITDTTHALRMTNYCDNVHIWIRNLSANN